MNLMNKTELNDTLNKIILINWFASVLNLIISNKIAKHWFTLNPYSDLLCFSVQMSN